MDLNLTGAIAANISLMQPKESDYTQIYLQIITAIITAIVTLVAVFLGQYLNSQSEKEKREYEKKKNWLEAKRLSYLKFLDVISKPIDESNGAYDILNISLEAAAFGNKILPSAVHVNLKNDKGIDYPITIGSLEEFIENILKIKYPSETNSFNQSNNLDKLRETAAENFRPLFLRFLMEEYAHETGGNRDH